MVEDWWLRLARGLVEAYPEGLVVLGRELAKEIGRLHPWSHSTLSNFANKKVGAARDLQEALCKKFRLPPPIFFPRTFAEASQMLGVQERHDRLIADAAASAPISDAQVHEITQPRKQDARETAHRSTTAATPARHKRTSRR